MASTDFFLGDR